MSSFEETKNETLSLPLSERRFGSAKTLSSAAECRQNRIEDVDAYAEVYSIMVAARSPSIAKSKTSRERIAALIVMFEA